MTRILVFMTADIQAAGFSMRTLTRVPLPGWLSMCHSPPMALARWRMLVRPKPCCAYSLGGLLHAHAVIGHGHDQCESLLGHG